MKCPRCQNPVRKAGRSGRYGKKRRNQLSHDLTHREQTALVRLASEASEVVHACTKTLRWGFHSPGNRMKISNAQYLHNEIHEFKRAAKRLKKPLARVLKGAR